MYKLLDFFKPIFRLNYKHPKSVLLFCFILAAIASNFAIKLKVDTDIANLLPEDHHSIQALELLKQTVGGESGMEVAIKSPSFEANKRLAEDLIPKSLELFNKRTNDVFFKRAEYKKDISLLVENALFLATPDELKKLITYLSDEVEQAKLEANPFYFDLDDDDEEEEEVGTDGVNAIDEFQESYESLVPKEYSINVDSTVLVIKLFPSGSKSNKRFLDEMFSAYDSLVSTYHLASYHPEMEIRYGGRLKRYVLELESIMNDVFNSFATGISSVLFLVMIYFSIKKYINYRKGSDEDKTHGFWAHVIRFPVPLFIIGIPLILSLIYTFGIAYYLFHFLNTMTSVLFVILFGMGIDYGLHFYARYIEKRSDGLYVIDALEATYESTGVAITTSALTTSTAMYILTFADFRGFSEFGFISGTGILLALLSMLFILPSIIVLFERHHIILINRNEDKYKTREDAPPLRSFPLARTIVLTGLVLTALILINTDRLLFEYDFGKLEPVYEEFENYRQFVGRGFSSSLRNPAYVIADNRNEVISIVKTLKANRAVDDTPTIKKIESLPERFPETEAEIDNRLALIGEVRELLNDPFLLNNDTEIVKKLRKASSKTKPLPVDSLPEFIKDRFVSKDGSIGNFVIIYPSQGLSDGRNSIAFKNDVGTIVTEEGDTFYAASTSIVAANMLDLMIKESPYMVSATFIIIFIIMYIAFKSMRWTLIALIPLIVGLIWTFGIMMIFDIPFNFYNLVVLPAILGIGEDNGVHIASRYIEEGKNSMWTVLASTGQHISMGSFTTMLGFAGLLFTNHPGLRSIGLLAVIGIGMTLFTAVVFLPALVQYLENKGWIDM